jgi:hypothetical protein
MPPRGRMTCNCGGKITHPKIHAKKPGGTHLSKNAKKTHVKKTNPKKVTAKKSNKNQGCKCHS